MIYNYRVVVVVVSRSVMLLKCSNKKFIENKFSKTYTTCKGNYLSSRKKYYFLSSLTRYYKIPMFSLM